VGRTVDATGGLDQGKVHPPAAYQAISYHRGGSYVEDRRMGPYGIANNLQAIISWTASSSRAEPERVHLGCPEKALALVGFIQKVDLQR
jgi:hypothetical protein